MLPKITLEKYFFTTEISIRQLDTLQYWPGRKKILSLNLFTTCASIYQRSLKTTFVISSSNLFLEDLASQCDAFGVCQDIK